MQDNKQNTRITRSSSDDVTSMIYGKIPPSAIELEKAILGHILTEQNAYNKISSAVSGPIPFTCNNDSRSVDVVKRASPS